jgi:uncharacterized protein (DUF111 family)
MALPALKREFKPELNIDQQDLGSGDTFRYNVLSYVVEGNYDRAIEEIKKFLERDFEQPQFIGRVERYLLHAIDLVNAIRAKRNFPGANMLTMAKQKDLNDKFKEHFKELQYLLKKVEKIQRDVRIEDIRSTVLIVRALINSVFVIALFAFAIEIHNGLFQTAIIVADDIFNDLTQWVFRFL